MLKHLFPRSKKSFLTQSWSCLISSRKARTLRRFSRDWTVSASRPGVSGSEEESEAGEASEVAGLQEEALTSLHLEAEL